MWSDIVQLNVIKGDLDMLHFKYSYQSNIKRCKFKTNNIRHFEINVTAIRQIYKLPKGIT